MHYQIEANEDMSSSIEWRIFRNMERQDDVNDICRIFVKNADTMVNYKELQIDNLRRNFAIFGSHTNSETNSTYITILAMMCSLGHGHENIPYYLPSVKLFSIYKNSQEESDDKILDKLKLQLHKNFTQKVAKMLPLYWFWTYFEKKAKEPCESDDPRNNLYNDFEMVDEFVKQSENMNLLEDIESIAPMVGQFKVLGPDTVSQFQDYVYEQKKGVYLDSEDMLSPMSSPEYNPESPPNIPGNMESIVQDLILVKLVYNEKTKTKYLITMGHSSHMLCIKTVCDRRTDDSGSIWIRIINPCHYVKKISNDNEHATEILKKKKEHVQNIANLGIYHMWIDVIKMNSKALSSNIHKKYSM